MIMLYKLLAPKGPSFRPKCLTSLLQTHCKAQVIEMPSLEGWVAAVALNYPAPLRCAR